MKRAAERSYRTDPQEYLAAVEEKPKNLPALETVLTEVSAQNSESSQYLQELLTIAKEYQEISSQYQTAHVDCVQNKLFLDGWYYGPSIYFMASRLMENKVNLNTIPEAAALSLIMWVVLFVLNVLSATTGDTDAETPGTEVLETPTDPEDDEKPVKNTNTSYRDYAYRRAHRAWLARKKIRMLEKIEILAEELHLFETRTMAKSTPESLVPLLVRYKVRKELLAEASRKHRLEDN